MSPDVINAAFEFGGAAAVWASIIALHKCKKWEGFSPWNLAFFQLWGMWNVYYYPTLGQKWSFIGGLCLVISNTFYLYLVWYYRKRSHEC